MDSPVQERYYRCYFISNDHVVGYENVFSHDDAWRDRATPKDFGRDGASVRRAVEGQHVRLEAR